MTKDNWEEIHNELYDLREEFLQKWRKNINDLKYYTKVKENDIRISEIINSFITIMQRYEVLYQVILDNKDVDYENNKTYMEHIGLRKESEFYSYSGRVIDKLEEILKSN